MPFHNHKKDQKSKNQNSLSSDTNKYDFKHVQYNMFLKHNTNNLVKTQFRFFWELNLYQTMTIAAICSYLMT